MSLGVSLWPNRLLYDRNRSMSIQLFGQMHNEISFLKTGLYFIFRRRKWNQFYLLKYYVIYVYCSTQQINLVESYLNWYLCGKSSVICILWGHLKKQQLLKDHGNFLDKKLFRFFSSLSFFTNPLFSFKFDFLK